VSVAAFDPVIPQVAAAVRGAVGERPVLVLGSRALGTARPDSDVDAYVVVPGWRVVLEAVRLRRPQRELEARLGVPVSLNPLPRRRLARGGMLPFKLRCEAVVACAPQGWRLGPAGTPPADPAARRSYAMSGLLFALEDADAKALLHAAQLELGRRGVWRSSLGSAASALGGAWPVWAGDPAGSAARAAARSVLVPAARGYRDSFAAALVRGVQWAALRTLSGRPTFPLGRSPANGLASAACALAVGDAAGARAALPRRLRRRAPGDRDGLVALVAREWPSASPLAGF
jgi:predicted nucleotidyltransferase